MSIDAAGWNAKKYTGESGRTSGERFKKILKTPSPYMTTSRKQATAHQFTTSTLWTGRGRIMPDHKRIHLHKG